MITCPDESLMHNPLAQMQLSLPPLHNGLFRTTEGNASNLSPNIVLCPSSVTAYI